jgi:hypothetical protein
MIAGHQSQLRAAHKSSPGIYAELIEPGITGL